jgi:hypothetical protein
MGLTPFATVIFIVIWQMDELASLCPLLGLFFLVTTVPSCSLKDGRGEC